MKIIRLFVSSTFDDLKAERNALQALTFPRLRAYCRERGASFQAIDLRWGVSGEAALDQQTMNICLSEIRRCQDVTPRPNFLVLLGHRYGWLPPPPQVPTDVFDRIKGALEGEKATCTKTLEEWYLLDANAVPAEYVLRPRAPDGPYAEPEVWRPVEEALTAAFRKGAVAAGLAGDARLPFCASATHQEIAAGALGVADPDQKVLCVFKTVPTSSSDDDASPDEAFASFYDRDQTPVERLKAELCGLVPDSNIVTFAAEGAAVNGRPTDGQLEKMAEAVFEKLRAQIDRELEQPTAAGDETDAALRADAMLDDEGLAHRAVAETHLRHFVGRKEPLAEIAGYLDAPDKTLLVLSGKGGTGKSALLSEMLWQAQETHPDAQLVYRFVGSTPQSSNAQALLGSLCRELCRRSGGDESTVPLEFKEQSDDFRQRLETFATPLILVLDALDQLALGDPGRNLAWLPFELPERVRLIVSTRPDEIHEALRYRKTRMIELEGMAADDGALLLERWLTAARRTLQDEQRAAVLDAFAASERNPLYLRLAFEEARRWKAREQPEALAVGVEAIIRSNLFDRLAREQHHGQALVSHALGYLAASRHGLSEDELQDVLSRDPAVYGAFLKSSHHLPPDLISAARRHIGKERACVVTDEQAIEWLGTLRGEPAALDKFLQRICGVQELAPPAVLLARLRADLDAYLTVRDADGVPVLDFYHRELRDTAAREFLQGHEDKFHGGLADYFRALADPAGDGSWKGGKRYLRELPHHLIEADDWDTLIGDEVTPGVLTDLLFIQAKCEEGLVYKLVGDYNAALAALPEFREENEWLAQRDAAMIAYNKALREYAVVRCDWWFAKERGETRSEPPYPSMPDELMDEHQRAIPEESSPRAARLRHFVNFLLRNAGQLHQHSADCLMIAYNDADNSPVSRLAERYLTHATGQWLCRSNTPRRTFRSSDRCFVKGHSKEVTSICFMGGGHIVTSTGDDGVLCLWDVGNGERIRSIHESEVGIKTASLLHLEQVALTVGGYDTYLRAWNIGDGRQMWNIRIEEYGGWVDAVDISHDDTVAVTVSNGNHLKVWCLARYACLCSIIDEASDGALRRLLGVRFLPGSRRCVTYGNACKVWDTQTGHCIHDFGFGCTCISVSPDGRLLAVATGFDLQIWDVETRTRRNVLAGHVNVVTCLCFSPDGQSVCSGSADHTVRLWDVKTGCELRIIGVHSNWVSCVQFSPNGRQIMSGGKDKTLRCWAADIPRAEMERCIYGVGTVHMTVNSKGTLAVSLSGNHLLAVWDIQGKRCLKMFNIAHIENCESCRISNDDSTVYIATWYDVWRLDTRSGNCIPVLSINRGPWCHSADTSGNGRRVVAASWDNVMAVWDVKHRALERTVQCGSPELDCVSVDSAGLIAISVHCDESLVAWNLEIGAKVRVYQPAGFRVLRASLSHSARWAIVACSDMAVRVLDMRTGCWCQKYVANAPVVHAAMDMDGTHLVCGTEDGQMHFISPRNLPSDIPAMLTASSAEKARCPHCTVEFTPPESIYDTISEHVAVLGADFSPSLELPDETFDDPRLLVSCPHCGKPLKFNPFMVDGRADEECAK